jgi:transcriptional regulator with XRE-family HTH domain
MTLGQKIKELRESKGMLQRELASKLEVGDSFLSKIERNQKVLKKGHLASISKIFNFSYTELKTLWLANKVYDIVKDENKAIEVLKVAEQEVKYVRNGNNLKL